MGVFTNRHRRLATGVVIVALFLVAAATVWGQAMPSGAATLAYSRNNQLRLVGANGGSDRLLWTAEPADTIRGLDWRPDGGAIAFASDVQDNCSVYQSDLYTIRADGLGLQRITNSPLCELTADFPTGEVAVTIKNQVPDYSVYRLYVQGAPAAVTINVAPGATKTVKVKNVADLGGLLPQQIVVSREDMRWSDASVTVNVIAGATAAASSTLVLGLDTNSSRNFGAAQPAWRENSTAVGFVFGAGELRWADPYPVVAEPDEQLAPDATADDLAWSPVDDLILYSNVSGIFLIQPDETGEGQRLVENLPGQQILGLDWLPDGHGFVFSQTAEAGTAANLAQYDLETSVITPLTNLTSGFLRQPGVSLDGQLIAFERASRLDGSGEIWVLDLSTGKMKSLGVSGAFPDWQPQRKIDLFAFFFVPMVGNKYVGVIPSPTPTQTPTATPTLPPTATLTPTSTDLPPTATSEATTTSEPTATVGATTTPSPTTDPGATATTPPNTPTPSATPANLPLLKNGDFEGGPNGDWLESLNGIASPASLIVIPQPIVTPRSGQYLVWMGSTLNEIQRLSQPVVLSGGAPLYLQFYYQAISSETTCTADVVHVLINDTIAATIGLCTAENTADWQKQTVDLGAFVGQSVSIRFEGIFDEATVSSFFIDDVSFVRAQ